MQHDQIAGNPLQLLPLLANAKAFVKIQVNSLKISKSEEDWVIRIQVGLYVQKVQRLDGCGFGRCRSAVTAAKAVLKISHLGGVLGTPEARPLAEHKVPQV